MGLTVAILRASAASRRKSRDVAPDGAAEPERRLALLDYGRTLVTGRCQITLVDHQVVAHRSKLGIALRVIDGIDAAP